MEKHNKKIAIFGGYPHNHVGGVENFKRNFIAAFGEEYRIVDFCNLMPKQNEQTVGEKMCEIFDVSSKSETYPFRTTRWLNKIVKGSEYDIVLLLTPKFATNKVVKSNKVIIRQPMDACVYEKYGPDKVKDFLDHLFLRLWTIKPSIKISKNVVFFTMNHNKYKDFRKRKSLKDWYIPNPKPKDVEYIENSKRVGSVFIGRYDYEHKGFENIEGANLKNTHFYGSSNNFADVEKIKNSFSNVNGPVKRSEISRILSKYKCFISFSNREGFQNTLVEALAAGLPCVIFDNLDQSAFFAECEAVKCVKFGDIANFEKEIAFFENMDYSKWLIYSKKAKKFSSENFEFNQFIEKWRDVINKK